MADIAVTRRNRSWTLRMCCGRYKYHWITESHGRADNEEVCTAMMANIPKQTDHQHNVFAEVLGHAGPIGLYAASAEEQSCLLILASKKVWYQSSRNASSLVGVQSSQHCVNENGFETMNQIFRPQYFVNCPFHINSLCPPLQLLTSANPKFLTYEYFWNMMPKITSVNIYKFPQLSINLYKSPHDGNPQIVFPHKK